MMKSPIFLGILGALLIVLILTLASCGASSVITGLELVTDAAEAAVTALAATGQIPAPTVTLIDNYLSQVSSATEFAVTELESTDTTAVKASKIIGQFAMIVAPDLPPGIAQGIVAAIQSVAKSVASFLATLGSPGTAPTAAQKLPNLKLSDSDRGRLDKIRVRAQAVKAKVSK